MAPFKEDNYLIIQPGSRFTLCSFGRNLQESLALPNFKIPTRVYQDPETGKFKPTGDDGSDDGENLIYPVVKGKIVNVDLFNYFLKLIFNSVLKDTDSFTNASAIAMSLVSSVNFSKLQCEIVTNFVFEKLEVGAFNILPSSLCASFAHGSLQHSLVVDIGYQKTDVSLITDFQNLRHLNASIDKGGQSVNEVLLGLLPHLNAKQIEELKLSNIFEVLSEEDAKNSFFGIDGLRDDEKNPEDEGVLDVAAIVTSEKNTRELLEKGVVKSNTANKEKDQTNSELEKNSFTDSQGQSIEVGKERFQGTKELIELISFNIGLLIDQVPDLHKRQEIFENIIVVGGTSKIRGFKELLMVQLLKDHLAAVRAQHHTDKTSAELAFRNETGPLSINGTGANNLNNQLLGSENEIYNVSQVPKSIKYLKLPDHFPIWKKLGNYEDLQFLGAQILTKQIFGTGHGNNYGETLYLKKDSYLSNGPVGIWEVAL